MQENCG